MIDNDSSVQKHNEYDVRVAKVHRLQQRGIQPWPAECVVTAHVAQICVDFSDEKESLEYQVAGRVMTIREHGKTIFATIQDESGKLQVYVKSDIISPERFAWFKEYIDSGDIVWFKGSAFRTKMGEITLKVIDCMILSKCLRPLPDKFHGIADVEVRYRHRYLDLIIDEESRKRFKHRSAIVTHMRRFLDDHLFDEVETPMLHPIPGGAIARPFVTHHNALGADLYLRIAPELYLKRLVVGGFERVYEINRNFRNEGISTRHNPEFTMVELYAAYQDYIFMMDLVEDMIRTIVKHVCGTTHVQFGTYSLDFSKPFKRISMIDIVAEAAGCAVHDLLEDTIDVQLRRFNITLPPIQQQWGNKLTALFETVVEPTLIEPTFVIRFPVEVSPLAKKNEENPAVTDRFELYCAGMELSNGFNELNDPFDQAERFREQARAHGAGDVEAHHYDADYINALEYGLPPTVGAGIGIDRLCMLLTNARSIRDVILFPTLKPLHKTTREKIT